MARSTRQHFYMKRSGVTMLVEDRDVQEKKRAGFELISPAGDTPKEGEKSAAPTQAAKPSKKTLAKLKIADLRQVSEALGITPEDDTVAGHKAALKEIDEDAVQAVIDTLED